MGEKCEHQDSNSSTISVPLLLDYIKQLEVGINQMKEKIDRYRATGL